MKGALKISVIAGVALVCAAGWHLRQTQMNSHRTASDSNAAIPLAELANILTAADSEFNGIKSVESKVTQVSDDSVEYRLRVIDYRNVSYFCQLIYNGRTWHIIKVRRRFAMVRGLSV